MDEKGLVEFLKVVLRLDLERKGFVYFPITFELK